MFLPPFAPLNRLQDRASPETAGEGPEGHALKKVGTAMVWQFKLQTSASPLTAALVLGQKPPQDVMDAGLVLANILPNRLM